MTGWIDAVRGASRIFLVLLVLSFSAGCATAADKPAKVTGMFSDMTYDSDGGDVLGIEVFVVYSGHGYFVVYQSSEGEPTTPAVIPAKVAGSSIRFAVPPSADPRGAFAGTIGDKELVGSFSGNQQMVHLKRKASYWQ